MQRSILWLNINQTLILKESNIFCISAFIDILGFSNHLEISSNDLRTTIGKEIIERLKILDRAIDYLENEQSKCGQFFPSSFRATRFNDALILGMDIESEFLPAVGKPDLGQWASLDQLKDFKIDSSITSSDPVKTHLDKLSFEVSQFIGIVSRVHNFINDEELKINMPGCRSVISSGMRYKFIREKDNVEDYYSANFSFSNAYMVNEYGEKYGFGGNKCYMESNVAQISTYNKYCKRAIGFLKYVYDETPLDPYDGTDDKNQFIPVKFITSSLKEVSLFRKKYFFREINTFPGSNMQLFPEIIRLVEDTSTQRNPIMQGFLNCLNTETPNLKSINDEKNSLFTDPVTMPLFLTTPNPLTNEIKSTLEQFNS